MDDLTIEVDDDLFASLLERAKQEGCDVGELARRLLTEDLNQKRE